MHHRQFQSDRGKQQPESRCPTASPASTTCNVDQPRVWKFGEEIEIECGPLSAEDSDPSGPAIELLRKLGFGREQQEWPSSHFGPVLPDVLEQLKRAHQILTSQGFVFVDDPSNPLGDGRSWVLKCEPPIELPQGSDPGRLVQRCLQKEGIKVATRPVLDCETLLIPLWDSGKDSAVLADDFEPVGDKQTAKNSLGVARAMLDLCQPEVKRATGEAPPRKKYHSALKRHIKNCLTNNPKATAFQVCGYLDERDVDDIPASWLKNGNRELTVAYQDEKVRPLIDSMVSKVRHDLGI